MARGRYCVRPSKQPDVDLVVEAASGAEKERAACTHRTDACGQYMLEHHSRSQRQISVKQIVGSLLFKWFSKLRQHQGRRHRTLWSGMTGSRRCSRGEKKDFSANRARVSALQHTVDLGRPS